MRYREGTIPRTVGQLRDRIGDTILRAPRRQFPETYDFDGTFFSMERGLENLRERLGHAKADQLREMLSQAKAHYEDGDNRLGGGLLNDAEMVLIDRQPWAYPKELYRWAKNPWLPELSEADLLDKGDDD